MEVIAGLAAVALSTFVVFGYLIFIWWLDRYEREPFWLVMVAFIWGALGGTALGCMISLLMSVPTAAILPAAYSDFFSVVIAAPLAEEFTKGLIFVVLIFTSHLDNETDGLIYGAAAGLGFAVVENLLYFGSVAADGPAIFIGTVIMRTLFTALVHAISSALLGYSIGYVRHRKLFPTLWIWPVVGFALAVANHGLWNFFAWIGSAGFLGDEASVGAVGTGVIFVVLMSLTMFVITQLALRREQKIIARYLHQEARSGVLPADHAEILPSWRKRRRGGWLSINIPRKDYIKAATLLAFRHYQMDTAADRYREKYRREVEKYREILRGYLGR